MNGQPRSSLARVLPKRRTDAATIEAMRRKAWREQRVLSVAQDHPRLDAWEKQFLDNIGRKLYGDPL